MATYSQRQLCFVQCSGAVPGKYTARSCCCFAVAHVHEEGANTWWRFDDETVTEMPDGPIGEKADHGVAAHPATQGKKVGLTLHRSVVDLTCSSC